MPKAFLLERKAFFHDEGVSDRLKKTAERSFEESASRILLKFFSDLCKWEGFGGESHDA